MQDHKNPEIALADLCHSDVLASVLPVSVPETEKYSGISDARMRGNGWIHRIGSSDVGGNEPYPDKVAALLQGQNSAPLFCPYQSLPPDRTSQ